MSDVPNNVGKVSVSPIDQVSDVPNHVGRVCQTHRSGE